jgi:hypothetical protein
MRSTSVPCGTRSTCIRPSIIRFCVSGLSPMWLATMREIRPFQTLGDRRHAALDIFRLDVAHDHRVAGDGERLRDAVTHGSGAENADLADFLADVDRHASQSVLNGPTSTLPRSSAGSVLMRSTTKRKT